MYIYVRHLEMTSLHTYYMYIMYCSLRLAVVSVIFILYCQLNKEISLQFYFSVRGTHTAKRVDKSAAQGDDEDKTAEGSEEAAVPAVAVIYCLSKQSVYTSPLDVQCALVLCSSCVLGDHCGCPAPPVVY